MKTLAMVLLSACLSAGCEEEGEGAGAKSPAADKHPLVGASAPAFELESTPGKQKVSLEEASGKVAIVDFWATWCEPCRESFPAYQRLVDKYKDDLVVIGVSVDDEPDGIPQFASETGAKFPLVWDQGQKLSKTYKPPTMPTSYVIDKQGIVRFVHAGFHAGDDKSIESEVKSLM